jgi:hypothetical protein
MQGLGITAVPWEADKSGSAQGIACTEIPGIGAVIVGACDTRTSAIYGKLEAGDTCVHSTGPSQAAQVVLKEKKKQACVLSKDLSDNTIGLLVDGINERIQLLGFKLLFQFSREDGVMIGDGGANIMIKDGVGMLVGTWIFGGTTPIGPVCGCATAATPPGPATPGVPIAGIFYGV